MVADGGAPTEEDDDSAGESDGTAESVEDGAGGAATGGEEPDGRASDAGEPVASEEGDPGGKTPGGENAGEGNAPTDEAVVAAASAAAEGVVLSRYRRSDVRDVDVAVSYEDGLLEVDVYLNVPDADDDERVDEEAGQVADDAALAAIEAVDRLFERGSD